MPIEEQYGASADDWAHFDLALGLTEDLLPVVSNPKATISPNSKMKGLGKTPSQYNSAGDVVGLAKWTERVSTGADIDRWSAQGDYGICIQTRRIRAIDIDVDGNDHMVDMMLTEIAELVGRLPTRWRADSSKILLAFEYEGELYKRVLPVGNERIELLATGQQFIAIGTHPKGMRYQWAGGLPRSFPVLTLEQVDQVWTMLEKRFGTAPSSSSRARKRGETIETNDPVVPYLVEHWETFGQGNDGQVFMRCPFEDHHTSDSGETATAYFPAGTGGYEQGHFRCLHAHCDERQDHEYLDAIGYRIADFETLPAVVEKDDEPEGQAEVRPWPTMRRDDKGRIEATVDNMAKAIEHAGMSEVEIRYDEFKDEIVWTPAGQDAWRPFSDQHYVSLQRTLERRGFKSVPKEMLRDVIYAHAKAHAFDTAIRWLELRRWDGHSRVDTFLTRYFGVEDTPYTRAVSRYLWTALAGRVLEPGCKVDMVPILVGDQGLGKSVGVKAIAPTTETFCEVSFAERDEDLSRKMRGRLVGEIGELRGLHSRELEHIKAWVTRTHEDWTPKFKEFNTTFPRRLVFIGTTNKDEFLADETGNRRWLPVRTTAIDVEALRADRDQLWAEGAALFTAEGVAWADAMHLAAEIHDQHMMSDAWEDAIERWFDEPDVAGETVRARGFLQVGEVMAGALSIETRSIRRGDEMRVAAILRKLGLKQGRRMVAGKKLRVWEWGGPTLDQPGPTSKMQVGPSQVADFS